jgi:aspartate dehydrogenase
MRGLGIVGAGALGNEIAAAVGDGKAPGWHLVAVIARTGVLDGAATVTDAAGMVAAGAHAVIEAAGVAAVPEHVPGLLAAGRDVVVLSTGALGDPDVRRRVERAAAGAGAGRLVLPAGAIAGLDALRAAALSDQLDEVVLTTTKPARAVAGAADIADTLFDGRASEAVVRYPNNINVAATVALAGVGFERTRVILRVDPALTRARHQIVASGGFGRLELSSESEPATGNPASSRLAALSAVDALARLGDGIRVGG